MTHPLRHLVAMSTAGLLFVGGVAAAAGGNNPLSPKLGAIEDATPLVTTTTTVPASETSPESDTAGDALFDEICEDAENHGEAVSTVAKDKTTVGAEHGAAVSEMAKSDCGKTDDDDEEEEEEESEERGAPAANKSAKNNSRHNRP